MREATSLECRFCGYKANLSQALTNQRNLAEPPVEEWARELAERSKPTPESLQEVRSEYAKRRRNRFKRTIRSNVIVRSKKLRHILLFVLIAGILAYFYINASEDQKNKASYFLGIKTPYKLDFQEGVRSFAFFKKAPSGVPAFWPGCKPLTYEVRQNYASDEDLKIIQEALDEISVPYQRKFEFAGLTNSPLAADIKSNILIDFTSLAESQDLTEANLELGEADVAGVGSPFYVESSKPIRNSLEIIKGQVRIEKRAWLNSNSLVKKFLIIHEIGHAIGLTHPEKKANQVMGYNNYAVSKLGDGDILGLRILSAIAGCQEVPDYLRR